MMFCVVCRAAGGARTPLIIPLVFRGKSSGMPSDLKVEVAATHTSESGEPRLAIIEFLVRAAIMICCFPCH